MKTQEFWNDDEKVIVHNIIPEEITGEDKSRKERHIPSPYDIIIQQPTAEEITEEEPPKVIESPKVVSQEDKLLAWCLPAIIKQEIDPVYGDIKRSVSWGDKFSFETVLLNRSAIGVELWAPLESLERSSIIYLWEQREWWSVNSVETNKNGIIISCFPSDQHPSF
jgi:hypothetical protein